MQLYEVHRYEGAPPGWSRTLAEAQADAKLSADRDSVSIALRDYPSDQATFCGLFNGVRPEGKLLRRWKLTARGGLREVPTGGEPEPEPVKPRRKAKPEPEPDPPMDAGAFWADLEAKRKARKAAEPTEPQASLL